MIAPLRIATRGSRQARAQSEAVAAQLAEATGRSVELVLIETAGDLRADVPLHSIGGQGVFVKEVQNAVLDGRADLAAHSAKDMQSSTTPGLAIGAFTLRRDPRDALIGSTLADLAIGATVATGSVRRRAQLALVRPDLRFVELRGNIDTRLDKVPAGGAIVMAVRPSAAPPPQVLDQLQTSATLLVSLRAAAFRPARRAARRPGGGGLRGRRRRDAGVERRLQAPQRRGGGGGRGARAGGGARSHPGGQVIGRTP